MPLSIEQVEDLEAKFDEIEQALLGASGDKGEMSEEEMKKIARKAAEEGDEDEPEVAKKGRKARKASDDDEEEDDEDEDDNMIAKKSRKGRKARKAMSHDDEKDPKDAKIASLSAALTRATNIITRKEAEPLVNEMLTARANAGMDTEALTAFRNSMYKMTLPEIQQRHKEDAALLGHGYAGTEQEASTPYPSVPFVASATQGSGDTNSKSLSEMFS